MGKVWAVLTSCGIGAGLAYLFDPDRGRRRRAVARDKVVSAVHAAGDAIDTTSRDVTNRTRGLVAGIRSRLTRDEVTDEVLVERVRSRVGFLVSHPRSIAVTASGGRVTLGGPVLTDEVDRLLGGVAAVRGVRSVDDRLELHDEPGDVPGLQGEPRRRRGGPRFELLQENWSPSARFFAGLAGGAAAVWGLRRAGLPGLLLSAGGTVLVARAATNLDLRRLVGLGGDRRAVTIRKAIEVQAPIDEVFEFWSRDESFPRFMSHVREVRRLDGRSRWTVAGPGGVPIEWEIEMTQFVPNQVIAWRTVEGAAVAHAGTVRFEASADGATRVEVTLSYTPPGGALGHGLASILGSDPRRAMDEDLVRLKSLLEEGRTRARGERATREEPT
jgi:uncharacterized membrane protein